MEEQTGPSHSLVGPHRTSQKVKRSEKLHSKPYERPPNGSGLVNGKVIGSERPHPSDAHRLRRSASFVDSIRAMVTKPFSWLTGSSSSATNGVMLQSTSKTRSNPDRGHASASENASTDAPEKSKPKPLSSSKLKLNIRSKRRTSDSPDGRSLDDDMVRSPKKARHTSPGSVAAVMNGGIRGLRPSVSAPFLTSSSFPSHSSPPLIPVPPLPRLIASTRSSPTRAHLRAGSVYLTQDASLPKPRSSLAADDQRMRTVSPYRSTPLGSPTRRTADGLGGLVIPSSLGGFEKAGGREVSSRSHIASIEGSAHAVFGGINGVTNFSMVSAYPLYRVSVILTPVVPVTTQTLYSMSFLNRCVARTPSLSAHGLSRSLLFLFQASSLRHFGGILRRSAILLTRSSMLWRKHFHGPMLASYGGSSGPLSVSPRRLASEGEGELVE